MRRIISILLVLIILMSSLSIIASANSTTGMVLDSVDNIKMVVGEYFEIPTSDTFEYNFKLNGVVSYDGEKVTAIKKGTAFIQIIDTLDFQRTFTYAITVDEPVVESIVMEQGETHKVNKLFYTQWAFDDENIAIFDTESREIRGINIGETFLRGTNERNSKIIYKVTVIEVGDTEPSTLEPQQPQETIPEFTVEPIDNADIERNLSYMIVGEYCYVDNPNDYNWVIKSYSSFAFDGKKIIALENGSGKLIGVNKEDLRRTITYNITVGEPIVRKLTLKVGNNKQVIGYALEGMTYTWHVADENIISLNGNSIVALSQGVTYLYGKNDTGGKYTFEITVVSDDSQINNSTNSTEPSESQHSHSTEIINEKPATYFKQGYTGDKVCTVCGETIEKGKVIKKKKLNTPTVKRLAGGKRKITVRYSKVKDATGYQIKYKLGKKAVTKTYNKKTITTKFLSVKKKGTYKVYVRAFAKQGKSKAYSSWTKAKKVKVK